MAIATPTAPVATFDTAPALSRIVIPSVAFVSGRLYFLAVEVDRATPPDLSLAAVIVNGGIEHGGVNRGASWTQLATPQAVGTARNMAAYAYVAAITETVQVDFHFPGGTGNSYGYTVVEVASGFKTGAAAIVQSKGAAAVTTASVSAIFDAAPTTGNLLLNFVAFRANSNAVTPRTNWTEVAEADGTGTAGISGGIEVQYVFDPSLESTASASGGGTRSWGMIAVEVAAAIAVVPTADVAAGSWTTDTGATTGLYAAVDEGITAVDTDYIQSSTSPAADRAKLTLASAAGLNRASTWTLVVRHKKTT